MRKLLVILFATFFMSALVVTSGSAWTGTVNLTSTGLGSATGFDGGFSVEYSATVKNKNGPDTATNVVVTGGIPGGTISGVSTSQGTVTISGDSFTIAVGSLAPGAHVTIGFGGDMPFTVPHGQPYCGGHVTATSDETDSNPSNNSVQMCVVVP